MPEIGLFEAIHTARSLRRLKPDPVPEALITQVLDAAIRAPSAGNAQNWAFVVVRDAELRRGLGAIYRKGSAASDRGAIPASDVDRRPSVGPHGRGARHPASMHAPAGRAACRSAVTGDARAPSGRACLRRADPWLQHLSRSAEHHPRVPWAGPRNHDHHQSPALRERSARPARPAR